ncbi:N utilization substance protein B [Shouchella clausii]|uniref:transcription antitermination factor NusB n=1 Tax=Shouchella clausii TaxID=79880 RepID=UPI00079796A6|nr:transcription antitermination factor NusB [Shouchella clausii]KKI87574.1 antitermination protein NusB [Shouchella clausii]GIN16065.1 N utilization substance protein B [Shouchella clausii]
MNRRVARLRAVQTLYQLTLIDINVDKAIENTLNDEEEPSEFYNTLVYGTLEHQDEIDGYLSGNLKGYTLDRLGHVDRAIARMGLFEMLYLDDIPVNVTLNEAIELAKAFGGTDAGRFINGVLSNSYDMAMKNK